MTDACRIDFCKEPPVLLSVGEHRVRVFCAPHGNDFVTAPEGARVFAALRECRLTQGLLVAALADFRTRVELEHARDKDPLVIAARGSK